MTDPALLAESFDDESTNLECADLETRPTRMIASQGKKKLKRSVTGLSTKRIAMDVLGTVDSLWDAALQ